MIPMGSLTTAAKVGLDVLITVGVDILQSSSSDVGVGDYDEYDVIICYYERGYSSYNLVYERRKLIIVYDQATGEKYLYEYGDALGGNEYHGT